MLKQLVVALASAGMMFGLVACAEGGDAAPAKKPASAQVVVKPDGTPDLDALKKHLEERLPGLQVAAIRESEYPGLIEIIADGRVLYASPDGHYVINGAMFDLERGVANLTDERLAELDKAMAPERLKDIEALGESSMIVFKAANEKHKVTVFTDIDCGYCRKLHSQIDDYNKLGITIRYIAFPRAGIPSESYDKLVSVWCAKDPKAALTEAKHGGPVPMRTCDNPIKKHFALVEKFNLHGTPAIVLEDGTLVPGYVPPQDLAKELDNLHASR